MDGNTCYSNGDVERPTVCFSPRSFAISAKRSGFSLKSRISFQSLFHSTSIRRFNEHQKFHLTNMRTMTNNNAKTNDGVTTSTHANSDMQMRVHFAMQIHENSPREKGQFICEVNKSRINIQKFSWVVSTERYFHPPADFFFLFLKRRRASVNPPNIKVFFFLF